MKPNLIYSLVAIGASLALSLLAALPFCRTERAQVSEPAPLKRPLSGTAA